MTRPTIKWSPLRENVDLNSRVLATGVLSTYVPLVRGCVEVEMHSNFLLLKPLEV
jgi:hypothetical protein